MIQPEKMCFEFCKKCCNALPCLIRSWLPYLEVQTCSILSDRAGKLSRSIIISRQPVTCQSKLNKINGILLSGLSVPDKSLLGEDMLPFVSLYLFVYLIQLSLFRLFPILLKRLFSFRHKSS